MRLWTRLAMRRGSASCTPDWRQTGALYNNKERFYSRGELPHLPSTPLPCDSGRDRGRPWPVKTAEIPKTCLDSMGSKSLRAGTAKAVQEHCGYAQVGGRLQNLTETEQQAIADALDGRLLEITAELAEEVSRWDAAWGLCPDGFIGYILVEIAEGGTYTIDSVIKKFNDEYRYHIGNELAAKVRDLAVRCVPDAGESVRGQAGAGRRF